MKRKGRQGDNSGLRWKSWILSSKSLWRRELPPWLPLRFCVALDQQLTVSWPPTFWWIIPIPGLSSNSTSNIVYLISTCIHYMTRTTWLKLCKGSREIKVNSLWPSDTIWRQRSGSTLAQVMTCCLTAPSHYLNQCWLIISEVQWHAY